MKQVCDSCGCVTAETILLPFVGQLLCPHCLDQATVACSHCGTRIWNEENTGGRETPRCQQCYDRYYISCVHCGRLILEQDACYPESGDTDAPYCPSCWLQWKAGVAIHDYYF